MSDSLSTFSTERPAIRRARASRPRIPADAVERPRLTDLLDRPDAEPLTLIVAPAGSGKTILVAQWLHHAHIPAAWLRLDDGDNDLDRFLRRFADAISGIAPLAARALADELARPDRPPAPDLGALLASELSLLDDPLVVVLDDAEWVTAPLPLAFLQALARELAGHARLVILSRAEPAIGIGSLRGAGLARVIAPRELAFTTDEATDFIARAAPAISPAEAAEIIRRLDGWAAGLRIAATASSSAVAASSHDGDLAAFVVETILDRLTAAEGAATLRLALFERLSVPLAAAFLDIAESGATDLLRRLRRHGMLLSDAGDGWIVITPLVREALAGHLASIVSADDLRALHHRAARAAASVDDIAAVIRHGLAAGDADFVRAVVAPAVAAALDREDWARASRWLDRLPEAVIESDPMLLTGRISTSIIRGHVGMLREMIERARGIISTMPLDETTRAGYLAELVASTGSFLVPLELDPTGWAERFGEVIDRIDPSRRHPLAQARFMQALALGYSGRRTDAVRSLGSLEPPPPGSVGTDYTRRLAAAVVVAVMGGSYAQADRLAVVAERFARPLNLNISLGWALLARAVSARARGDIDATIEHCTDVIRFADRANVGALREAMFMLAHAFQTTGRYDQAMATLDRFQEIVLDYAVPYHLPALAAMRAQIDLATHGLTPAVRSWLTSEDLRLDTQYYTVATIPQHIRIEALLAVGDDASLAEARTIAAGVRERLEGANLLYHLPSQILIEALIARQSGDLASARALVLDAITRLERSEAPGLLAPFVDRLAPLLEDIARGAGAVPAFARRALATHRPATLGDATNDAPVEELLTERELEVLAMLAWRYSDREIGDAFGISPLTARKHAGNIYKKLGVSGRRRALEDAQRRGWVAPTSPR